MIINSSQNNKVKRLKSLKTKKGREQYGLFCIEGVNILKDLPKSVPIKELFIKESDFERLSFLQNNLNIEAQILADNIFDSVCDTISPNGALATAEFLQNDKVDGDIIPLLCGISDAGNMGTIFRTAAAKGILTVLLYGDCVDIYSPKVVRASMGGIFHINIKKVNDKDIDNLLQDYLLLALDGNGKSIYEYKRVRKALLAVGNEAHGLPKEITNKCNDVLALPMSGNVESLNAAVSMSIALYML